MKKLHSIKGTHDILPNEIHKWKALEKKLQPIINEKNSKTAETLL